MSDTSGLVLTAALLAANAFFVAAEFALVSARRAAIEPRAEAGSRAARRTLRAMEQVSLMMAGAQLGITVCSLLLGYVSEPAIAHLLEAPFAALGVPGGLLHPIAFVIALSLVTVLHVVLGEMVPKNVTLAGPDRAALVLGPPMLVVVTVLRPLIVAFNWTANRLLRLAGVQARDEVASAYTRDEVAGLVDESAREGLLDLEEHELLTGALTFEGRTAASLLLPLDVLVTIPSDATPRQVEAEAARTGYSRLPVRAVHGSGGAGTAGTADLVGYVHLKDVLETDPRRRGEPLPAKRVRALPHVSTRDSLRTVLATMQSSGAHLARITDRAGTTLGVVALEDVLEEIVGQVRDEAAAVRRR